MKLVFLGDSLTWGQFGGDWVAGVARAMPEHTVINAGVGGDTVVNLVARLESVLDAHMPDAMFVMVGGNDAVSYGMPDTRLYYKSAKQVKPDGIVSPERYEASYRELLTTLQLQHVQTFVGLAPTEYNAKLISLRQQYNSIAEEIARRMNVPTLDLASAFVPTQVVERVDVSLAFIQEIGKRLQEGWQDYEAERQRWGYSFTFDGMHLLPSTAERFSALVVAFLREHLA